MAQQLILGAGAALLFIQVDEVAAPPAPPVPPVVAPPAPPVPPVVAPPAPPVPPSGLVAIPGGPDRIDLTWSDNSTDETGYSVQWSADGVAGWATLTSSLPAGSLAYHDMGLAAGTTRYYRVQALRGASQSAYSNEVSAETWAVGTPPSVPAGLTASAPGPARVDLAWSAAPGATSYVVERSPDGGVTWATAGTATSPAYVDFAGLSASTPYVYRVRSSASGANSAPGATATATTTGAAPAYGGQVNTISAASQGPTSMRLAWYAPINSADPAAGYVVLKSADAGLTWAQIAVIAGTATRTLTDPAITPGSAYRYDVRPLSANGVGVLAYEGPAKATVKVAGVLPASHGLMTTPRGPGRVDVSWLPVYGAASYVLERAPDVAGSPGTWAALSAPTASAYSDTSLSAATTYWYRFSAVGAWGVAGTSAPSDAVSATTGPASRPARDLLRPEDFTYLGSFTPPFFLDPPTNAVTATGTKSGLALRYVGGQLRLLAMSGLGSNCRLYEFTPGALKTSGFDATSYGSLVKNWGFPADGRRLFYRGAYTANGSRQLFDCSALAVQDNDTYEQHGLAWDPATSSLLVTQMQYYNPGYNHPVLSRVAVDDAGSTLTASGPWRLSGTGAGGPNTYQAGGGPLLIPQWFADAHLGAAGTRRVGLGFGGNYVQNAYCSPGPALFAVNSADLTAGNRCQVGQVGSSGELDVSPLDSSLAAPSVPATTLASTRYDATHFGTRPPGYTVAPITGSGYLQGQPDVPASGYGKWQWTDRINGGGCWIDDDAGTRAKHGFFVAAWFGFGNIDYKQVNVLDGTTLGGNAQDGGIACGFGVMDPADMAAVAAGGSIYAGNNVAPRSWWPADFYNADRRKAAYVGDYADAPTSYITGSAFDPATSRLYLYQADAIPRPGGLASAPLIHVYSVAN